MSFLELLLIGVGLSMDAFAVAICQGLCMPKLNWRYTTEIAIFFGGFQALMPFLGWALGSQFAGYIQNIDHWVAFALLGVIGGHMIRDVNIVPAISVIGCTTFCLSFVGVIVGNFFGARYKRRAELSGGAILILLGIKILMEHLGIIG